MSTLTFKLGYGSNTSINIFSLKLIKSLRHIAFKNAVDTMRIILVMLKVQAVTYDLIPLNLIITAGQSSKF